MCELYCLRLDKMSHPRSGIPALLQTTELMSEMKCGLNNPETEQDSVHIFGVPKGKAKEFLYAFFGSMLI